MLIDIYTCNGFLTPSQPRRSNHVKRWIDRYTCHGFLPPSQPRRSLSCEEVERKKSRWRTYRLECYDSLISSVRAESVPNCYLLAIHGRTHHFLCCDRLQSARVLVLVHCIKRLDAVLLTSNCVASMF